MSNRISKHRRGSHAVAGLALTTATLVSTPSYAADDAIQEVVVTGSRIVRKDYESASPIVTISERAFQQTGTTTVETLLNTLPQFVPSVTNTSNNPSNNGQANIELRGLGTQRTLVLLDGKRIVPANNSGVVDVNMLPASLIKDVEIISGGASAVYGSDAVAGVVNFKTKDFEGVEVNSNWGQTNETDGREYQIGLTAGKSFAEGRGKIIANVAYADREAVLAGQRDFARIVYGFGGPDVGFTPQGSPTILEGTVRVAASQAAVDSVFGRYGVAAGSELGRVFAFNDDRTLFSVGDGETSGSVRNYRGAVTDSFNDRTYTYNFGPTNYLQLPLERKTGFARGTFELAPSAEIYVQGLWADYASDTQAAPTPGSSLFVPVTNPFIPADLAELLAARTNPNAPFSFSKRLAELGPRHEVNDYEVYQAIAGLRGQVFGSWNYDVYGSYGEVKLDNIQLGSISRTKLEQLTFAADGGVALCGGLDPFGAGSISQECAQFVTVDAVNTSSVKQTIGEASLTGPLFALPAGDFQAAFGILYKKDEAAFIADEQLRAKTTGEFGLVERVDVAGFNATADTIGSTDSTEFYVEALVPILHDLPGVQKLDATFGYRLADHSTIGNVSSYKAELTYKPTTPFLVRGSYQRAVRAPNILELFQPLVTNFPQINPPDPCSVNSDARSGANAAAVRALCLAQGVPSDLIDNFTFSAGQVEGLIGGNPELQEETADTVTFGAVFHSQSDNPWLSTLQLSLDWYRINITDAVAVLNADVAVDRCFDPEFNPGFATDTPYCRVFNRTASSGEIFALQLQQNIGGLKTSGIDVQVDWAADAGPGRVGVNWVGAWLHSFDRQDVPGVAFTPLVDTIGQNVATAFPNWKWSFNATYDLGGLGLNARWRYIAGMSDFNEPAFEVPSVSYFDAGASYKFASGTMIDGLVLRVGVTNLTDKKPLLYPSYVQSNTDPSSYDVLGRRYFLSANYSF